MDSVERKLVRGWEAKPDTPSLAIGYICNGWTVTMQLCYSLHNFVMYDWGPDGRHALKRIMSVGGLYVDDNRNKLTSFFLENKNLQWLLMVDSDIEFTYHTIYQLLDAADPVERPVVSALYFSNFTDDKLGVQPLWYFEKEKNQFSHFLEPICLEGGNVLHKIDACGAGCMLVHRSVFERIAELHQDENYKWFKHLEVNPDTVPVGEDLVFCQRIREAGFPIYGLGLVVQHCKMGRVNEHVYLKDHPDYMQNISVDELGDRVQLKRVA